jgi:type IX secretion system PorP/SprF family membrane protein
MKRHACIAAICFATVHCFAQDPQFTQFYSVPTYLSPAFAGTAQQSRLGMVYRDQWPAVPGSFITANVSYDQYVRNINSGFGVQVMHDRAGSGALRSSTITGQYAYEIELKRKTFIRPALELSYSMRDIDMSKLVFGDQLARGGGNIGSFETYNGEPVRYFDAGFGMLFFTEKLWLGMSAQHLNEPNQSLQDGESIVPRKFGIHGGYRLKTKTRVIKKGRESTVFAFNYRSQGKYDQLDLGGYYEREPMFAGIWYRGIPVFKRYETAQQNNDAISAVIGFIHEGMRIGYSYDLTISGLADSSGGAHELSIVYEWRSAKKRTPISKRREVPCAKF